MALTFFHRCEAENQGTGDYSAGDTTGSLTNGGLITTAAKRVGTYGVEAPTGFAGGLSFTSPGGMWPSNTDPANSVGAFGLSFYQPTTLKLATTNVVFGFRCRNALSTKYIQLGYGGNGTNGEKNLSLYLVGTGSVTITTTGNQLTAGAWWGVVCRFDYPGDRLALEIYNASGTLVDSVTSTADLSGVVMDDISLVSFGQHQSGTVESTYFDNVFIGDSYDEPIQNNFTIEAYADYVSSVGSPLILPHRSAGGFMNLSGNFRG